MREQLELATGWQFRGGPVTMWLPARVPGHIHEDLVREAVIAHPFKGFGEAGCQWVDRTDWEYKTHFCLSDVQMRNGGAEGITLRFLGLDTLAKIFVNGVLVGESSNMFIPLDLSVGSFVRQGENELRIEFRSAVNEGEKLRAAYFEAEKIDNAVKSFDERAFVRKAPYMSGWDWGPRLVSCGVWRSVQLIIGEVSPHLDQPSAKPLAQLVRNPDSFGESFEFHVDGRRLWIRGANWIPNHSMPGSISKASLRKTLTNAKEFGMNMLRVWGGGLYETDDFYEICAELDLLVWQDFLFACSYYPENDAFLKSVETEATVAIKRLRQYPNLVLWCGNNENHTMWYDGWQSGQEKPSKYYGEVIYEKLLPGLVAEHDPDRPYIASSPIGGVSPNGDDKGDCHYWTVWHGKGDWRYYVDSKCRFCSEFGFASSPSEATWKHTIDRFDERTIEDPVVRWHDKTLKPFDVFRSMVELHYPPTPALKDWVFTSQLNQRDAMKAAVEHFRRGEFCSGTLIWQINDCWPVESWALFDCEDTPKAAAFELKRIYSDLLISLERVDDLIKVHVINDGIAAMKGSLSIKATGLVDGSLLKSESSDIEVSGGERKVAAEFSIHGLNTAETIVSAKMGHATAWTLLLDPKNVRFAAPQPITISRHGGERITITSPTPVVDLRLMGDGDQGRFSHNFLTLPEGGSVTICLKSPTERFEARSLAGEHPVQE